MKGSENILTILNQLLQEEFIGFTLYLVQSKIWGHWEDKEKYRIFKEKSGQKKIDADKIIERILSLEKVPIIRLGEEISGILNVEEQFKTLLAHERNHLNTYQTAIELCVEEQDIGTRILLEKCFPYVEKNIVWLELQLSQIGYIGIKGYLSS